MDRSTKLHAQTLLRNTLKSVAAFMDDPDVQEIMINGANDVWLERKGLVTRTDAQISDIDIVSAIKVLARLENKEAKEGAKESILDARLEGMRVAAAMAPTSVRGASIAIRKHSSVHLGLGDYVSQGAMPQNAADMLRSFIVDRKNIIVAGGTSSGKTTALNALIAEIDVHDRVLTIEDTPELKVRTPNWVSLMSNEQEGITTRDLVRLALRYRPDRIVVGEVRGGEAFDLLDAANTGHEGSIATIHANGAFSALSRFESLILRSGVQWPHEAIKAQIAETFHYIVFMARRNGKRALAEIMELKGYDFETKQYLYEFLYRV